MDYLRLRSWLNIGIFLMICVMTGRLHAGGSGLNTIVVINQNSANSRELGNYFCERRQVPPDNVLRILWAGNNISWTAAEFQAALVAPLLTMLSARGLTNQIDYVVLSMDIPFQTANGTFLNGTTSALFQGLQTMSTPNSYAGSELVFRTAKPANPGYSFLTTMITGDSLAKAKQVVDQGVASDATFPSAPVVLARSSDSLRNVRYSAFDQAIFSTRVRGNCMVVRTNSDTCYGLTNLLGYQTGLANLTVGAGIFAPGAMADSMTSFGGVIFGPNSQTTLLSFLNAGAAGSYGTVTEPYVDPEKFPDPKIYFYQARGFSLAECYYQSLVTPYQGLIVGEPLAAPFARSGSGQWSGISSNALLTGISPLTIHFAAADRRRPLQQVELFVDGRYSQTLTNLVPLAGNVLNIRLKNSTLPYVVPANATLATAASGLAAMINLPANTNATGVGARLYGDRIELHVLSTNRPAPPSTINLTSSQPDSPALPATSFVSSSAGTASALTTFPAASREAFLPSPIPAMKACVVSGTLQPGNWLRIKITKSTGPQISVSVTNQLAGATALDLVSQLINAVNSTPGLQDFNGVIAEAPIRVSSTTASFEVRSRISGPRGSTAKLLLTASSNLALSPTTEVALNDNLGDLQPRNHVYLTAGATNLNFSFPFNTTSLADGFHELTAVAYEGSHARTQTRISLPVRIQNSALIATLNLLDLPDSAPVAGSYHIEVTANTNNVSTITLFSTGGALSTVNSQSSATFTVNGSDLGAGLHPFYAVVQTPGSRYRTETRWIRLIN